MSAELKARLLASIDCYGEISEDVLTSLLRAAAAALPGDGWVLVPREITPEMEDAADERDDNEPLGDWGKMKDASRQAIWTAMIAAAPQPETST